MFQRNTPYQISYIFGGNFTDKIKRSISGSPSMALIAICVLSYLFEIFLFLTAPLLGDLYVQTFQFNPAYLLSRPWTSVTYIFLHNDFSHLLFNMLVLFFFGPALERRAGKKQMVGIFFTAGVLSAIGHAFMSIPLLGSSPLPIIGASGAIYGVFAALAVLEPELRVYVYFIPMRIKHALVLFALVDFLMIHSTDMVAHVAHLSGLFVGLYMGYRIKKLQEKYWRSQSRW